MRLCGLFIVFAIFLGSVTSQPTSLPIVSSTEDSSKTAIEGFGTSFSCSVNTCLAPDQKIKWFKDNKLIAENRDIVKENNSAAERMSIQYKVNVNNENCPNKCSPDNRRCSTRGTICRLDDNYCCVCNDEEYKLVVTNVTFSDRGRYKCQVDGGNSVTILLQVVEGDSISPFGRNLTFDHTACCQSRNMSPQCLPMCHPGMIETHKFDPIPCQQEFSKLLHCSTEGGNISHTHCCRLHFVPAFCWEYCSGTEDDFSRANAMCIHWMPEIFQCYEQAFLPFPGPPESLIVNTVNSSALEACWDVPDRNSASIQFYTVRYQEIPRFPLLAGNIPFSPDVDPEEDKEFPSDSGEVSSGPHDEEEAPRFGPTLLNPRVRTPSRSSSLVNGKVDRKKRQTLVITTHNFATNETETREYRYLDINTTETCQEITNLKPSTQYFVYVTATNDFGTSLPSLRETATTGAVVYPNGTLPDIRQCCSSRNVTKQCLPKICDIDHPPSSISAFDLALTCRNDFSLVSPCLADGRDHTACCKEKGVIGECLKFCDGSVQQMGMSSVLCLSLDIQSIFSCLREGYVKLPSPPVNVTVTNVGSTSAVISWSPPVTNSDSVKNYSLFYKHSEPDRQYIEVVDAISPFPLVSLVPDSNYEVYVITRGSFGSSLKSSIVTFTTSEPEYENVCEFGRPLLDANGSPLRCSTRLRCPESHHCVSSQTDDPDLKYCCPFGDIPVGPTIRLVAPNITACCIDKGVSRDCMGVCSYKTTKSDIAAAGVKCALHIPAYIECGGDFRNDAPCCESAGVPNNACMDFCRPPLRHVLFDYVPCMPYAEKIIQCAHEGVLNLPGPAINVSVEDTGPNWVTLHWHRPLQNVPVERYEVYFNDTSMGNTSGLSITVTSLTPDQLYVAHVVSWNGKGSSLPSADIDITLSKDAPENDYKPRPPNTIRKAWYKDAQANITWQWNNLSVNKKPIVHFQFIVQYRMHPASKDLLVEPWRNVSSNEWFAILSNLTDNQNYDIKVVAKNVESGVEGLPSEITTINATNVDEGPTVDILFSTNPPFRVNTSVTVTCTGTGSPIPDVNLQHGIKHLSKGKGQTTPFTFGRLTESDGDEKLICTAETGGNQVQKAVSLIIHFPPTVNISSRTRTFYEENQYLELICRIKSLPRGSIKWFFKADNSTVGYNEIIVGSSNEQETRDGETETVKLEVLKILKPNSKNAGIYACRSCNDIGCGNDSVYIKYEQSMPAQGPDDLLDCCTRAKVRPECISICVNEITVNDYEKDINCASELTKLLGCTKDGINKKPCCVKQNVPDNCLQYCDGSQMNISLTTDCSSFQSDILSCYIEEHRDFPIPPKGIKVETLADGRVNVSWKGPESTNNEKSEEEVNLYYLWYKSPQQKRYQKIQSDKTYVILSDLEPNVNYSFTVQARTTHGWSHISPFYSSLVGSKKSSPSSSSAGVVLAVIFCLLLAVVVVLAFVYFSRRPYRLPTFLLKFGNGGRPKTSVPSGAVAFENPGYDREGQIRGLPGDSGETSNMAGGGSTNVANGGGDKGWEHARLETPEESPRTEQKGMRYAALS